ncbi:MAG: M48 family metalloprotease [Gammaproteobacteria bacterium]|nr:M48 family metalloprotease [Gammaproteobacteria bacterium]
MEKLQKSPDYVVRGGPVSSIVHIRKFLTLSIGIVVVVVGLGVAVFVSIDELATLVPFEMEKSLSHPYTRALPGDKMMDEYLQGLADKLLAVQKLPTGMQVRVHYVNSSDVNAFSTVGGHIFVFRGMLEKLPHENALMMLLAHEIAHIKYRHPLKGLGKGVVASVMLSMLFGTAYSDTVDQVFHDTGLLTTMKFSQNQEIIADEEGMRTYYQYYGYRNGISDLYRVVENNQQHMVSGLFYPGMQSAISERMQNIKRHYIKEMQNDRHPLNPFPARIVAQLHPQLCSENIK